MHQSVLYRIALRESFGRRVAFNNRILKQHLLQCRFLSSADTTATAESAIHSSTEKVKPILPRPIFPWRHETTVLPRLQERMSGTDIAIQSNHAICASMLLGVPLWRVFFGSRWKYELAEAAAFAFTQGVAGIVSNVYRVPFDGIRGRDDVNFSFPPEKPPEESSSSTQQIDSDYCPEVESMLQKPLRRLYESAHESGKNQLKIKLHIMEPIHAVLYRVFCAPFISSSQALENPELYKQAKKLAVGNSDGTEKEFYDSANQQLVEGKIPVTIEIEVLVMCDEVFQVIDLETGAVLQGSEDGRVQKVMHLVRLDTTVELERTYQFPYFPKSTRANWQIADIDDLLNPQR